MASQTPILSRQELREELQREREAAETELARLAEERSKRPKRSPRVTCQACMTGEDLRDKLIRVRQLRSDMDDKRRTADMIMGKAMYVGSARIDPVGGSHTPSRRAPQEALIEAADIRREILNDWNELHSLIAQIEPEIERIPNMTTRVLIRHRYCLGESFEELRELFSDHKPHELHLIEARFFRSLAADREV